MKFLGCLLGFFLAVIIYFFVAARHTLTFFYRMMKGLQPRDGKAGGHTSPFSRPDDQPKGAQGEGLFEQEGRQYVDFEEIKDE